jgi:hypothetical protein
MSWSLGQIEELQKQIHQLKENEDKLLAKNQEMVSIVTFHLIIQSHRVFE